MRLEIGEIINQATNEIKYSLSGGYSSIEKNL